MLRHEASPVSQLNGTILDRCAQDRRRLAPLAVTNHQLPQPVAQRRACLERRVSANARQACHICSEASARCRDLIGKETSSGSMPLSVTSSKANSTTSTETTSMSSSPHAAFQHRSSSWGEPATRPFARRLPRGSVHIRSREVVDRAQPTLRFHRGREFDSSRSRRSAEADGNRTRQGAFTPSPVLKTGEPTRHSDASQWSVKATDCVSTCSCGQLPSCPQGSRRLPVECPGYRPTAGPSPVLPVFPELGSSPGTELPAGQPTPPSGV